MLFLQSLALAACITPGSKYNVPELPLPARYEHGSKDGSPVGGTSPQEAAQAGKDASQPAPVPDEDLIDWWRFFGNKELGSLIDRGLSNNPDIRIALNRIVQAKARADQASAGKTPTVSAPLAIANQSPGGTTVGTAPAGSVSSGSDSGGRTSQKTFQASIRAEWRLNIWGEQSALADSANFQLWRAVYERENVQRNLAASLASSYVEFLSLNDRIRIAQKTEEVLSATLASIEKRVEAGDATLSELEQQRAAIFSARAAIPTLEQQRLDAIANMAFLAGTVPGDLKLSDDGLDSLDIPSLVPGLPSALLLRRPDVRMAEAQLLAADADVAVARARLLPPMDMSAQVGYSSIALSQLFLPRALFWSVVDSLTISIFDNGRKQNDKVFSQAVHEEMVESYVRTVHQAIKEVESALVAVRLADRRLAAQRETVQAARRAWDISTKVYAAGGVDYLTLLDTERSYHRYLDDYQRTRMEYIRGYISLMQALGGGVKPDEALPGKGRRPADSVAASATSARPLARPAQLAEGIPQSGGSGTGPAVFWQVELAGLYHRSTISAAWRDLRTRYPVFMENRAVLPRLKGRIEESREGHQAWYRLYVAKFDSPELADEFCRALKADQQRCRVISSLSDETVQVEPPKAAQAAAPAQPPSAAVQPETKATPPAAGNSGTSAEPVFWEVQLDERYPRAAVGDAWRKLLIRYSAQVEDRMILPRIQEGRNGEAPTYRLYVAKFDSLAEAEGFCRLLRQDEQQCRVISLRPDAAGLVGAPEKQRP